MDVSILANTCRCCMTECESMQHLYDKFTNIELKMDPNLTYSDAIYLCTNIEVNTDGGNGDDSVMANSMPQYICAECLRELRVAIMFRAKCEETDTILRKHLHKATVDTIDGKADEQIENLIIERIEYNVEATEDGIQMLQDCTDDDKSPIVS